MKTTEFRKLIREEIRKIVKEEKLQSFGRNGREWKDSKNYYYAIHTGGNGQYIFSVYGPDKKRVDSYYVRNDIDKIKASPYYDAYKQVRDAWNPGEYGEKNPLFGY
jgi:hypothetical protein